MCLRHISHIDACGSLFSSSITPSLPPSLRASNLTIDIYSSLMTFSLWPSPQADRGTCIYVHVHVTAGYTHQSLVDMSFVVAEAYVARPCFIMYACTCTCMCNISYLPMMWQVFVVVMWSMNLIIVRQYM